MKNKAPRKTRVIITATQVPFTRGGAELLVDTLRGELEARNFLVDLVQLPFSINSNEQLLDQAVLWRALDLSAFNNYPVDHIISTKFPSYMVNHKNKTVWLIHQHRQLYDLYGTRFSDCTTSPFDESIRQIIYEADREALGDAKAIYTISPNVSLRLKRYLDLESEVLLPPLPLGDRYRQETAKPYILSVGRICTIKRVDLIIKSLPQINTELKLKIVGICDEPGVEDYLNGEIAKHHLWERVEFVGRVDEDELITLFAQAFAVYYAPFDEDYGFVTLEALSSGKPVITASDSGGVLQFINDNQNGIVASPNEAALAERINELYNNPAHYQTLCANCHKPKAIADWDEIISKLCPVNR